MKKIFILMFSFVLVLTASAQYRYDRGSEYDRNYGYGDRHGYPDRSRGIERRIDEINREYDRRIWAVHYDRYLSRHEKRRAIRELNYERRERIRQARRWY
jgi:hypothetical protein